MRVPQCTLLITSDFFLANYIYLIFGIPSISLVWHYAIWFQFSTSNILGHDPLIVQLQGTSHSPHIMKSPGASPGSPITPIHFINASQLMTPSMCKLWNKEQHLLLSFFTSLHSIAMCNFGRYKMFSKIKFCHVTLGQSAKNTHFSYSGIRSKKWTCLLSS